MTEQLSWLDYSATWQQSSSTVPRIDTPRARNTDPVTSHEAADAIEASGELGRQQLAVLDAVRRWPGLTSLELGARMKLDRWAVARRLPELEGVYVAKGPAKTVNGRRHVTWHPIAKKNNTMRGESP